MKLEIELPDRDYGALHNLSMLLGMMPSEGAVYLLRDALVRFGFFGPTVGLGRTNGTYDSRGTAPIYEATCSTESEEK